MFGYSWGTILIILVIVLILFGPKRLPELGESIGKAIKSFKKAHDEPQPPETLPPKEGAAATGTPGAAPAAPAAPQASTCSQCHKEFTGDFAFCPHCGFRLKA